MKRLLLASIVAFLLVAFPHAQTDPTTLPLLAEGSLTYVGAMKVPDTASNGEWLSFGGGALAFNPAKNSLFISSMNSKVAEINIPADLSTRASYIQPFTDITEGHLSDVGQAGLAGLMVRGDKIYGTASIYFDAQNTQVLTHYSHSTTLTQASFSGWSTVGEPRRAGIVAGWMTPVPTAWRSLFGPDLTGQCCIPIMSRTSSGPAAVMFDALKIGQAIIPATPLLHYADGHSTLGPWEGSNPTYGATTLMGGMAAIEGTRSLFYFGSNGLGEHCYGNGTSDPALHHVIAPDGLQYCYDPTTNTKGSHAYPYRNQMWAYDMKEFIAVKAGTKQPWEVVPYGVWSLAIPLPAKGPIKLGGVAYDPSRQLIYIAQPLGEGEASGSLPLIHIFRVNAGATPPTPPVDPPTPPIDPPPPSTVTMTCTITTVAAKPYADGDTKITLARCDSNGAAKVPTGTKFTVTVKK